MDTPGTTTARPSLHRLGRLMIMFGALTFAFVLIAAPHALSDETESGKYWVCKYTGGPEGKPSHLISPNLKDPNSFSDKHGSFVIGPYEDHTEEAALAICLDNGDDNNGNDDNGNDNNGNDDNGNDNNGNDDNGDGDEETATEDAADEVEEGVLGAALDQDGDATEQGSVDDEVDQEVLSEAMTELPRTGADDPGLLAGLAGLLLAAGVGLLRVGRSFEPTT